jgi:hypothetical protein
VKLRNIFLLCGGSQELRVELPHHASLIGVEICRERERERERKREIERERERREKGVIGHRA